MKQELQIYIDGVEQTRTIVTLDIESNIHKGRQENYMAGAKIRLFRSLQGIERNQISFSHPEMKHEDFDIDITSLDEIRISFKDDYFVPLHEKRFSEKLLRVFMEFDKKAQAITSLQTEWDGDANRLTISWDEGLEITEKERGNLTRYFEYLDSVNPYGEMRYPGGKFPSNSHSMSWHYTSDKFEKAMEAFCKSLMSA